MSFLLNTLKGENINIFFFCHKQFISRATQSDKVNYVEK